MLFNKKRKRNILKTITKFIALLLLVGLSFSAGMGFAQKNEVVKELAQKEVVYVGKVLGKYSQAPNGKLSQDVDFNLFWEVWDDLEKKYVDKDKINEKKMFYGAIKGLVASVGDPYTVFMDPRVSKEFEDDLAGTFEGIGAKIGIKNDILTIIAPLSGMPAEKAGLMAGDKVLAIDGESTTGITIDEAVNKIRGPKGTQVTLTIYRENLDKTKDITITRGTIKISSVYTNLRDDNIFVVKITNFNTDTEELFNKAVREIVDTNPKGIILDLRNNPGGFLDTAIEVASEWIEDGVIVTEEFGDGKKNEYLARGRARLKHFPTVILVNEGSASASEIVAGALQDYEKAIIVGKKTFGKGSVQILDGFNDGSSLKITIAKWLTPKGNCISEKGITPDVEVDLTLDDFNADKDPQLDKAVEILNSKTQKENQLKKQ